MTLFSLALKNIKGNMSSFRTYYMATTFSVMVFFLFSVLIYHPNIEYKSMRETIQNAGIAVNVIIFAFLSFFIMYAIVSYAKQRSKDFAIMRILGATPGQVFKTQFVENLIIFIGAILSGIVLGVLLEKLFFTVINLIFELNVLEFYFAWKAIFLTASSFTILFLLLNISTTLVLNRTKLSTILEFGRKSEEQAKPNYFWGGVGLTMMLIAYYLAYTSNQDNLQGRFFLVILLTVIGSLFFYWHSVISIVNILKKRKKFFYKKINILWISDLSNRAKSLTWVMFFSTTVIAIGLTAIGSVYSITAAKKDDLKVNIYELVISNSQNRDTDIVQGAIKALEQSNEKFTLDKLDAFYVYQQDYRSVDFIKKSTVINSSLVTDQEKEKLQNTNNPVVLFPSEFNYYSKQRLDFVKKGIDINGRYFDDVDSTICELGDGKKYGIIVLLNDDVFEQNKIDSTTYEINIFNFKDFQTAAIPLVELQSEYYDREWNRNFKSTFDSQGASYRNFTTTIRFALVLALFVGIVFFISSGSMLYFNFYNHLENDRIKYEGISLVGLSKEEIIKSVRIQMAILFFLPNILAIVHSVFALTALNNVSPIDIGGSILTVVSIMFAIQIIYFFIINNQYNKHLVKRINWI